MMHRYVLIFFIVFILPMIVGCGGGPKPGDESSENNASRNTEVDEIPSPDSTIPVEKQPVQIREEIPEYPADAQDNGVEAWVIVQAFVGKDGKIKKAHVAKCSEPGYGFEKAALKAAYKCRYEPAESNSEPVGVWIAYKVDFVLDRAPREMETLTPSDQPPVLIYKELATYPRAAYRSRVEAYVEIKVYIDENGEVREAEAIKCSKIGYGFEEAAVKAARQYRYRPARKNSEPIGVWITHKIKFEIND